MAKLTTSKIQPSNEWVKPDRRSRDENAVFFSDDIDVWIGRKKRDKDKAAFQVQNQKAKKRRFV
jgi:hypothetical protein